MKILSLTNCPLDPYLGSGKTVLMFTEGLRSTGHSVVILEPSVFEPLRAKLVKGRKLRQAWGAWQHLRAKLNSEHFDLVEFYGDEFWLATWWLSRRKKRPLIVAHTNGLELLAAERGDYSNPDKTPLKRLRNRIFSALSDIAFRKADAFISLCEIDRQYVINNGIYPSSFTYVIPPGMDAEYVSRSYEPNRQDSVAFLGSWIERKGIKTFVRVMTEIMNKNPKVKLEIFGTLGLDATANAPVKRKILQDFPEAIRNRVTVHSRLNNKELADALGRTKVFFFPTLYEGYGMALAEAMACGCAVVTTPTGLGGDLVHDKDGLVCDFDDVDGFLVCIERLLNDSDFRQRIAFAGWQSTQELTWDNAVEMLASKYQEWHEASIR